MYPSRISLPTGKRDLYSFFSVFFSSTQLNVYIRVVSALSDVDSFNSWC